MEGEMIEFLAGCPKVNRRQPKRQQFPPWPRHWEKRGRDGANNSANWAHPMVPEITLWLLTDGGA
jgi:hypothetical protein